MLELVSFMFFVFYQFLKGKERKRNPTVKGKGDWGPSLAPALMRLLRADTETPFFFLFLHQEAPKNAGIFTADAARNAPGEKGSISTAQIINCAVWSPSSSQENSYGHFKFFEAWSHENADGAALSLSPVDS